MFINVGGLGGLHAESEVNGRMEINQEIQDHRNLLDWSQAPGENSTDIELPIDMRFNEGHILSIIVYSILMVFSAIGNFTVLVLILRRRRNSSSRINNMLMHLAIADLLVSSFYHLLFFTKPE